VLRLSAPQRRKTLCFDRSEKLRAAVLDFVWGKASPAFVG